MAKMYFRLKDPMVFAETIGKHVAEFKQQFDWVESVYEATREYMEVMGPARDKLRTQLGIETELEEFPDDKLMTPRFVLKSEQP